MVLIKGGYNPIDFASRKSQLSSDSFIISFENDQDIYNKKIGRVINVKNSVYENYTKKIIEPILDNIIKLIRVNPGQSNSLSRIQRIKLCGSCGLRIIKIIRI